MSQPPPLFVPDLTKPAGAVLDAAGNATCVTCSARQPVARMDVVGQGYRCAACSHKAQITALTTGQDDMSANLSAGDRSSLKRSGLALIATGVAGIVGGIALLATTGIGRYVIGAGIGSLAVGFSRLKAGGGGF
jgi:hypothetical protein